MQRRFVRAAVFAALAISVMSTLALQSAAALRSHHDPRAHNALLPPGERMKGPTAALDQLVEQAGNPVSQWRTWSTFHRPDVLNSVRSAWRPSHLALRGSGPGRGGRSGRCCCARCSRGRRGWDGETQKGHRRDVATDGLLDLYLLGRPAGHDPMAVEPGRLSSATGRGST